MSDRSTQRWYDAIVVGMGPAGSSTAYELSHAGLSVLGLEKQTHPRYKVCGGALSARIDQILPPDYQQVVEEAVHRLQFSYSPEESYFVESKEPFAFMVMRSRFDTWLVNRAQQSGAEVHEDEAVKELRPLPDGVEVTTTKGRYRGRVVVGADGAMSVVAQQLFPGRGLRKIPALESEIFGVSEIREPTPSGNAGLKLAVISLNAAKKGYGWIFPKRNGLSIGVGEFVRGDSRPKRSFQQFSLEEPSLAGLTIPAPVGHPIPVFNRHPGLKGNKWNGGLVHERAVLVGDAGHLVDPLLGEGILYAVRSGQLAGASIVNFLRNEQDTLEEYEDAIIQEFAEEFRIASKLNRVVYGLPRSWHRWLGRTFPGPYQRVLHRYCQLLQGRETYQTLWARAMQKIKPWSTAEVEAR